MTRAELVDVLASKAGLPRTRAGLLLDVVLSSMASALGRGERVDIRGFGQFSVRAYASRAGRHPKTHAEVVVSAKRLPYFRPGKDLRDAVNRETPLR